MTPYIFTFALLAVWVIFFVYVVCKKNKKVDNHDNSMAMVNYHMLLNYYESSVLAGALAVSCIDGEVVDKFSKVVIGAEEVRDLLSPYGLIMSNGDIDVDYAMQLIGKD